MTETVKRQVQVKLLHKLDLDLYSVVDRAYRRFLSKIRFYTPVTIT